MTVLRVIDFETNGMEPTDAVIEVGLSDLTLVGGEWLIEEVGYECRFYGCERLKPEARAVHHITPAEIEGCPPFSAEDLLTEAVANGVFALVAHNWDFESKWLGDIGALRAICTYKAALRIWPDAPSHSNGALRYWLEDQGLISPDPALCYPAHRAGPDAYVTAHLLRAILQHATGRELIAWTREPALLPTCPIGEWRGKRWAEVDQGFLRWMVNKPVEPDLVWNAQRELERRAA